jgi:tetratricopeptide (TPR) repeat protein
MNPFVLAAGTALIGAMVTDGWQQARTAVVVWWRKAHPGHVDKIEAELDSARTNVLAARARGDEAAEQALTVTWRRRLQELLDQDPDAGLGLRRLLEEHLIPILPAAEQAQVQQIIINAPQTRIDAYARGQSQQFVAAGNQIFAGSVPDRWLVPRTLQRDVLAFTGRDGELRQLIASAAGAAEAVAIHTVDGMAGVGKTALVKRAAHLLADAFPDGQLFIDLHGHTRGQQPADPSEVLADLLTSTGMPAREIPAGMEARAKRWRDRLADKKVLLVLDDAAGLAQVEPLLPGTAGCLVLITSRTRLIALDGARPLELDILPADQAIELFRRLAYRPQDGSDANAVAELAELCGYLPLAIALLAGRLAHHPSWNITTFTDDLTAAHDRLTELATEDRAVAAAFEMSYQHLPEDRQRLFRILGLHPGTDIYTSAAAALADVPLDQCRRELEALYTDHLIDQPDPGHYRFHDLIREYARTLTNRDEPVSYRNQAIERLLDFYLDRADKADKHLRATPGTSVPGDFTSRDDALAWLDAERPGLIAAVSLAESTGLDRAAMQLPLSLDVYLRWRRHFDELRTIAKISLDAARHLSDRHCEGRAQDNLGAALWELRRFDEAIAACRAAVAIFQETGERHGEGLALTNLGIALWKLRRFDEAIAACRAAVAIFQETGERHGEGLALDNLAAALGEERRFEEASSACRAAVAIFRETGERHGEGVALDNLGAALAGLRRFEEAITTCQAAVAIYRDTRDQHGDGHALTNLGAGLTEEHRFEEAIKACREAVAIFRETGDRHHEGRALTNLAAALMEEHRFEEAIKACREAVAIFRETGDRHGEGLAMDNLGAALGRQREFEETIKACRDAVAIFRKTGDRYLEGHALTNLAPALMEEHRFEEAIKACREAVAIFRETGDRHLEGHALDNLDSALARQRESEEAITASQDAAAIHREATDRHGKYWVSLTYLTRPSWTE